MPFLTSKNPNRKLLVSYKVKFSYVDKVKFSYVHPGFRMDTGLSRSRIYLIEFSALLLPVIGMFWDVLFFPGDFVFY
ncbi:MAG: hypothetical protein ABSF90_07530 [Syntrophobacteraceae bacterium]